jgi:hypothetical protein
MAPRTKLRRRCPHHSVVTEAEKGKSYEEPNGDEDGRFDQSFHVPLLNHIPLLFSQYKAVRRLF